MPSAAIGGSPSATDSENFAVCLLSLCRVLGAHGKLANSGSTCMFLVIDQSKLLTNYKYLEIDASFALLLYLAPFCFALIAKRSHEALFRTRSVKDMIVLVESGPPPNNSKMHNHVMHAFTS